MAINNATLPRAKTFLRTTCGECPMRRIIGISLFDAEQGNFPYLKAESTHDCDQWTHLYENVSARDSVGDKCETTVEFLQRLNASSLRISRRIAICRSSNGNATITDPMPSDIPGSKTA